MRRIWAICSIFLVFTLLITLLADNAVAQNNNSVPQNTNIISEIVVETNIESSPEINGYKALIINQSGLQIGSALSQENIAHAIHTLWLLKIFRDIQIDQERIESGFRVIIKVEILPLVNDIFITGIEEYKEEEIIAATGLVKNMAIGDRVIQRMRNKIKQLYDDKGFLAAQVNFNVKPVENDSMRVDVFIDVVEGKKIKIKSIHIVGNEEISDKKIKKTMQDTKEDRWYRSGEYNEEKYNEDKKLIVAMYKSEGFRDAEVVRDSTYIDEETEKMNLVIFIHEGKKYYFGDTTIEGNTHFTEEELRTKIRYMKGDVFNEQELFLSVLGYPEQNIEGIQTMYNNEGYLKTYINPIQTVREDSIDVFIDIAEGVTSNVSRVIIEGNTKTKEKIIRREIDLDPGMPFNRALLDRSRRDVLALNFFQDVTYDYVPKEDSDDVDIKFTVEEKQTGMASMGAGYSETDKLVGSLSFSNQNLFGNGQSINFSWEMGARRKAFQIGFGESWLFDTPTSFSFDIYNIVRNDYTSAFDEEKRKGVSVRLGRRLDKWIDYTNGYITYRLEDVDYLNPSSYYSLYLTQGVTSALSFTLTRDSRDMPQFASQGGRTSVMFELAGGPLGGDLSYYKYIFNNELYTPIFWKLSLMFRTRLGYLKGYQEDMYISYSERFMPGGTSWDGIVRGYSNRQVCPRLSGEEIGGETMMVNNLELQIPVVAQTLYGIVFYDFGNAWRNVSETNPFDTKRSAGIGARVFVPGMGNIGLDLGYGFDKLEGSNKTSGWRTHFQFGNQW